MTPDEHAHVQELEAKVKRYRNRIVTLKELNGELLASLRECLGFVESEFESGFGGYSDAQGAVDSARAALAKAEAHEERGAIPVVRRGESPAS